MQVLRDAVYGQYPTMIQTFLKLSTYSYAVSRQLMATIFYGQFCEVFMCFVHMTLMKV
jgi:hypothetical protein